MGAIRVQAGQAKNKPGGPTVAGHAIGPAGEHPVVSTKTARRFLICDPQRGPVPAFAHQLGVGLCLVPFIRVADPFVLLPKHYASLDTKRLGQAKRAFPLHSQGLDECRSVGKTPRPVLVEVHFFLTRHGHPAFGGRTIVPAGGDHGVAQNARMHFMSFRVQEQPGLAEALRERSSGAGAGLAFQSIKSARVVDD